MNEIVWLMSVHGVRRYSADDDGGNEPEPELDEKAENTPTLNCRRETARTIRYGHCDIEDFTNCKREISLLSIDFAMGGRRFGQIEVY